MRQRRFFIATVLLSAAVLLTWSNHFRNSFHFDDAHTVTQNPWIRTLSNIPRFFRDSTTFSTLDEHQSYRPLVTASIAIDYRLARGAHPFWFHVSTFLWYLAQLALTFVVFRRIMDAARPAPDNRWFALFAVALFGLHPLSAETVNYIIQRAEIQSTVGVLAGLALYICRPRLRKTGLYLAPVLIGMLAKPPAAVFAGILFLYILLFEEDWNIGRALVRSAPAIVACLAMGLFITHMEAETFSPGGDNPALYRLTQPWVTLHYFRSFFWPTGLSADSDMEAVSSAWDPRVIAGLIFVVALIALAALTSRRLATRPIAFGLSWFILALLPTAWTALAEVENDHRMYFPLVGLTLAAVWAVVLLMPEPYPRLAPVAAALILAACAWGTWQRNEIWRTEETLWRDVTLKSPKNGRGFVNYGLSLLERGDYTGALEQFHRARPLVPEYSILYIDMGVADGALGHNAMAEQEFRQALSLNDDDSQSYFYYARWLAKTGRAREAAPLLETAIEKNPADMQSRMLLLKLYSDAGMRDKLRRLVDDSLSIVPGDTAVLRYRLAN